MAVITSSRRSRRSLLPVAAPAIPAVGVVVAALAGLPVAATAGTGLLLGFGAAAAVWSHQRTRQASPDLAPRAEPPAGSPAAPAAPPRVTLADLVRVLGRPRPDLLPVHLTVAPAASALAAPVEDVVVAVVAEAVANARRHAQGATAVTADVRVEGAEVTVAVADDGAPCPAVPATGGLARLTAELEGLGGRLATGPRPRGGWGLVAVLPAAPSPGPR